jgi:hypothetical protein
VPTIAVEESDFYILRATPAQQAIVPILTAVALAAVVYFTAGIGAALLVGGVSLAASLGVSLIPQPKLPSAQTNNDVASGLNALGSPTNLARLGSRVPEIFGQLRIFPDLAIPAIEVWSGRTQKVTVLYTVGVGDYLCTGYRLGQTDITGLSGVSVTIYPPGSTMPNFTVARQTDSQQQIDLTEDGSSGGPFSAWVTAVGDKIAQLWVEIGFPSGLVVYKSSGGTRSETTKVRVEYQRIDIDSPIQSYDITFSASSGNPLRYTSKIQGLTVGRYQLRARRLDDGTHGDDDVHVSNCALIKVIGVENLPSKSRQTNKCTFLYLQIDNNDQVAQLSSLTFNVLVKRKLRLVAPGGAVGNELVATSFLRDAMYYVLSDPALGNFSNDEIDLVGLYHLHATLKGIDDGQAAEFNGIFDRWTSVDEMAQPIAQVARAAAIYDGGRVVFLRDEDQPAPISVFNRRVRPADDQSTRVSQFVTPDEEDGYSIDWFDAANDYVPRTYVYPTTAVNPKTIPLPGATHWSQIYRRVVYERYRARFRRRTAKISVTREGLICNPLNLVTIIDPWLDPVIDGDVLDYDTTTRMVLLDQKVRTAGDRLMRIRNIEGDLTDDVPVISNNALTDHVTLARDPVFPVVPRDPAHQVGNLYIIGTPAFLEERTWHVLNVTARGKIVELSVIEYAPIVFTCDTVPIITPPTLQ